MRVGHRLVDDAPLRHVDTLAIANQGWQRAVKANAALGEGVNIANGKIVYKPVADAHALSYTPLGELLD